MTPLFLRCHSIKIWNIELKLDQLCRKVDVSPLTLARHFIMLSRKIRKKSPITPLSAYDKKPRNFPVQQTGRKLRTTICNNTTAWPSSRGSHLNTMTQSQSRSQCNDVTWSQLRSSMEQKGPIFCTWWPYSTTRAFWTQPHSILQPGGIKNSSILSLVYQSQIPPRTQRHYWGVPLWTIHAHQNYLHSTLFSIRQISKTWREIQATHRNSFITRSHYRLYTIRVQAPMSDFPSNSQEHYAYEFQNADDVFHYFNDGKIAGNFSQSINLTFRGCTVFVRQQRFRDRKMTDYFINDPSCPAHIFSAVFERLYGLGLSFPNLVTKLNRIQRSLFPRKLHYFSFPGCNAVPNYFH